MLTSFIHRVAGRLRHDIWRITAATLLAALAAGTLGIAVPVLVERVSDELFPCMNCSCACPSAEVCWRDCCCYTHQEKLDWAEKNGVVPPEFVVEAAREERELAELPPCCQKRLAKASCCSKKKSCCAKQPASTTRTILLIGALRCRGLSSHWTLLPPCVVPPLSQLDQEPNPLSERIVVSDTIYSGIASSPDVPPPQFDV